MIPSSVALLSLRGLLTLLPTLLYNQAHSRLFGVGPHSSHLFQKCYPVGKWPMRQRLLYVSMSLSLLLTSNNARKSLDASQRTLLILLRLLIFDFSLLSGLEGYIHYISYLLHPRGKAMHLGCSIATCRQITWPKYLKLGT